MCSRMLLTGGGAQLPGLPQRLETELKAVAQDRNAAPFHMTCNPTCSSVEAWQGAAALAGLSTFSELWITKEQYEDVGASLCHRKCL